MNSSRIQSIGNEATNSDVILSFPKHFKSKVWNYFGFRTHETFGVDMSYAICRLCYKGIKYTGNTTNAGSHLINHHKIDVIHSASPSCKSELVEEDQLFTGLRQADVGEGFDIDDSLNNFQTAEVTASNYYEDRKGLGVQQHSLSIMERLPPQALSISLAVADYLIGEMIPLSTVDSQGFQHLLNVLNPHGVLLQGPTLKHNLQHIICNQMYIMCRQKVMTEIAKATQVFLAMHCWPTVNRGSVVMITGHFMTNDWTWNSYVLETRQLGFVTDAKRWKVIVGELCNTWKLTDPKVLIDIDAGQIPPSFIMCFSMVLKMVAVECFNTSPVVELISRVRELVKYLGAEGQRDHFWNLEMLQPDCSEDWTSTYNMLVSVKAEYNKLLMKALDLEQMEQNFFLTNQELKDLEELLCILKPLSTSAIALLEQETPMAAIILPVVFQLKKSLQPKEDDGNLTKLAKQAMLNKLLKSCTENTVLETLTLCTVLDPRFKSLPFMEKHEQEEAYSKVIAIAVKSDKGIAVKQEPIDIDETMETPAKRSRMQQSTPADNGKFSALSALFQDVLHESVPQKPASIIDVVHNELKEYRQTEDIALNEDPLMWWKNRAAVYPHLSCLAKVYLAVPATVVPTSLIYTDARQRELLKLRILEDDLDSMEILIFLHHNKNKILCKLK